MRIPKNDKSTSIHKNHEINANFESIGLSLASLLYIQRYPCLVKIYGLLDIHFTEVIDQ